MAFTPNTTIYLCYVPIDSTNKNQITFDNVTAQTNYMLSTRRHTFTNYTYQRQDNIINVDANIDTLYDCNYVMYQNTNFSNKWFYAFITKMTYYSNNTTAISIKTDVYQTWMFDIIIKPSFIEREHVNDDSIGKNIKDEGLETGEYIQTNLNIEMPYQNDKERQLNDNFQLCFVVCSTTKQNEGSDKWFQGATYINGQFCGCAMRVFYQTNTNNVGAEIQNYLQTFDDAGKGDSVYAIFCCPRFMFLDSQGTDEFLQQNAYINVMGLTRSLTVPINFTNIDGYVPKNNKLFCYPYSFLYVANNNGDGAEFKREFFSSSTANFSLIGNISLNPSVFCIPENYNLGKSEFALTISNFPQCMWSSDVYANWQATSKQDVTNTLMHGVGAIAYGASFKNPVGFLTGAQEINNAISEQKKASLEPPQAKGHANSNGLFVANKLRFDFYNYHINKIYAKQIDDYFTMFGYKIDELKLPNITGRKNWNYVKTIDCNIVGDIPNDDLTEIKAIFNNGVTFWHNPANVLNYSLDNSII